jgi:hypothetical protein
MRRALRLFGLSLLTFGMSGLLLAAPPGPGGPGGGFGPGPGPHGPGLPSFAHELWIGSALYFVAAGTYYLWNSGSQRYEEVSPPPAAQGSGSVASYEVIAYPARGQSTEQQARDRYECHSWAVGQSGFDPATATQAVGVETSERYRRALGACLSGRGYSIS